MGLSEVVAAPLKFFRFQPMFAWITLKDYA
jgi:hypothetical protein